LSSIIFILCIEILSNRLEQNDNIKGIQIGNKEIKQSLFADDAIFLTMVMKFHLNNYLKP